MVDRVFRYSATGTFLRSPRQYYLRYILNLEPAYPERSGYRPAYATDSGTIGHAALTAHYGGLGAAGREAAMRETLVELNVDPNDKYVWEAKAAVERYMEDIERTGRDRGLQTVEIEKRLSMNFGEILGDNVTVTGQPDWIVQDAFGSVHIYDHKFPDKYGDGTAYLRQALTYGLLYCNETGIMPVSFVLNQVARKKPKKPTVPFIPVHRVAVVYYTPEILENFEKGLRRTLEGMVRLHQEVEEGDLSGAVQAPDWTCDKMCRLYPICCGSLTKDSEEIAKEIATHYRCKESQPQGGDNV